MRTIISSCMFVGLVLLLAPAFAIKCPPGVPMYCAGTVDTPWHCWCRMGPVHKLKKPQKPLTINPQ